MNDLQRLRAFARATIDAAMGQPHMDSGEVLDDARKLGLVTENLLDRPCRRDCPCEQLEVGVACYRKTDVLTGEA
jgi:hypothetical protein